MAYAGVIMLYPPLSDSFDPLFNLSFRYAWRALRQIFPLIIILTAFIAFLNGLPELNEWVQWALDILVIAVVIFILTLAFYRVDGLLRETPVTWKQAWSLTLGAILKIYLICFSVLIGCEIIFFVGRGLVLLLGLTGAVGGLAMMMIISIPIIILLIFFYLTIPLLALYEKSSLTAFYDSVAIARRNVLPLIIIYAEIAIALFVISAHTHHGQWLKDHYLMEVTTLIVLSVIIPLIVNQTLLLLHNVRLKRTMSLS
jgi:hypothetical protein